MEPAESLQPEPSSPTSTPRRPPLRHRKDVAYGEDGTIGDWTVSTENVPCYKE